MLFPTKKASQVLKQARVAVPIALAAATGVVGGAVADQLETASYDTVLTAPDDLNVNMRFLNAQMRAGDFEGAVVTLQRLLLLNPQFDKARLVRVAVMIRLGDDRAAQSDLDFLENRPLDAADRARADHLQSLVSSPAGSARVYGTLRTGFLYQGNAQLRPGSGLLNGVPFAFPDDGAFGGVGQLSLFAEVPFAAGSGHAFIAESRSRLRVLDDADARSGSSIALGPRFDFGSGTVDLLAIGAIDFIGSDFYGSTLGGRVRLNFDLSDRVEAGFATTLAHKGADVGVLSAANVGDADGRYASFRPHVTYRFSDRWRTTVHGLVIDHDADSPWYSYTAFGGGLTVGFRSSEGISLRLGGHIRDADYEATDPRYGGPAREETRYVLDFAVAVPFDQIARGFGVNDDRQIAPLWAAEATVKYSVNQSNVAIYDNAGWTFGLAIARRFSL
ncbi:MAG: hypothetical protein AAF739_05210 [Pseudomonadota bacterium]